MAGEEPDPWSAVAEEWAELWGPVARPAWDAVLDVVRPGPGARALDVGCGSGELAAHLTGLGLRVWAADPAPGMVRHTREVAGSAHVVVAGAEQLPWPGDCFDLVTAVNVLSVADDVDAAVFELVRVTAPGGHVAVIGWAEAAHNDLDLVEAAVARDAGEEPHPDGELMQAGRVARLLADAGLEVVADGTTDVPWVVPDADTLARGVLLGEDPATIAEVAPVVVAAAEPFRVAGGGYRLVNCFRYVVGHKATPTR